MMVQDQHAPLLSHLLRSPNHFIIKQNSLLETQIGKLVQQK